MMVHTTEQMPHFFFLGQQVLFVVVSGFKLNGHAFDYFNAVPFKTNNLFRVVRQQTQTMSPQIHKDLRTHTVITQIRREAKPDIGLHRIQPSS